MQVSDILRVKGGTLFTVQPDEPLSRAMTDMAEKDIGSLVVMAQGQLVGMLTFREVIQQIVKSSPADPLSGHFFPFLGFLVRRSEYFQG